MYKTESWLCNGSRRYNDMKFIRYVLTQSVHLPQTHAKRPPTYIYRVSDIHSDVTTCTSIHWVHNNANTRLSCKSQSAIGHNYAYPSMMCNMHTVPKCLGIPLTHPTCLCRYCQSTSLVPSTSVASYPWKKKHTQVCLGRDQSLISWAASPHPPGCCGRPGHDGGYPGRRGIPEVVRKNINHAFQLHIA